MYAKAHPFGYKPVTGGVSSRKNEPCTSIQTVTMKVPYEVTVRNKKGEIVYKGRGKNRKPLTETFFSTVTRTIKHYSQAKKGRTLADMVYSSPSYDKFIALQAKKRAEKEEASKQQLGLVGV